MNKITFLIVLFLGVMPHNVRSENMIPEKNVDQVQVEEVLKMLDIILKELPIFIEKYELNSNLSWEEWKRKYWLLAPAGTIILGVKFYFVLASVFSFAPRSSSIKDNWG